MNEKPQVPNLTDIAQLPRWAKVLFLSRCAARAIPLIRQHWPALSAIDMQRLALAGANAEASSRLGREVLVGTDPLPSVLELMRRSEELANMAGYALSVAASAAAIAQIEDPQKSTEFVASAMERMVAAYGSSGLNEGAVVGSVWPDYVALVKAAGTKGWTDETAIPADEVLGSLWPDGTPPGWPE